MKSKFANVVLDGRWKFKNSTSNGRYEFQNIYNNEVIKLSYQQVNDVLSGKTTLSKIMSRRIGANTKWLSNNTIKNYHEQKMRHAKGGKLS